jgi:hypothetical protein
VCLCVYVRVCVHVLYVCNMPVLYRSRRAEVMRTAAAKFVTAWVAANGKPTNYKGVYLHMLVAHVPDMIKRFGDLRLY